jgi:hypothetical protein
MVAEFERQCARFPTTPEHADLTARLVQWHGDLTPLRQLDPAATSDDWTARGAFSRAIQCWPIACATSTKPSTPMWRP